MENKEIVVQDEKDTAVVVELKKPLDYNGKIYNRITMDLESLTGKDSLDIEEELMRRKKGAVIYGALNNDYVLAIAAKEEPGFGRTRSRWRRISIRRSLTGSICLLPSSQNGSAPETPW